VNASVSVLLENVTLRGNLAKLGVAVHIALITGTEDGAFDATFVTLLDNQASETMGGADLHLSAATGVELPIVLRGVLLGGVGAGSDGPSFAGTRFATAPVPGLEWDTSFVTDTSCDGSAGSVITPPTFATVPFLSCTTDHRVPEGAWESLDAVACDAAEPAAPAWPAVDQRGLTLLRETRAGVTQARSNANRSPSRPALPTSPRTLRQKAACLPLRTTQRETPPMASRAGPYPLLSPQAEVAAKTGARKWPIGGRSRG
jgi:hypothetical protein